MQTMMEGFLSQGEKERGGAGEEGEVGEIFWAEREKEEVVVEREFCVLELGRWTCCFSRDDGVSSVVLGGEAVWGRDVWVGGGISSFRSPEAGVLS